MRLPSLNIMMEHAVRTVRRFPVEILVALVGTITAMVYYYTLDRTDIPSIAYTRIILSAILVLNVALTLSITHEARRIGSAIRWGLLAVVGGVLTWFVHTLNTADWDIALFMAAFITVHAAVALSATWNRTRLEFWEFNKTLFLRVLTGGLFSGVLMAGMCLALVSLDALFNVAVQSWMYAWVGCSLLGVFNTLFVLGGIPATPATPTDAGAIAYGTTSYPKGLRIFTQFVLLPLVVLFLCILYAYGTKVLFFANLDGTVSGFVIALSVAGILAYLLLYPLRNDEEHTWIRLFARWFGYLMIPLSVMLWIAIVVRIDAYGITEARYAVIALSCCLTLAALYLAAVRDPDLRVIPALLFVAGVVSFAGPFNMASVSVGSQTSRANVILEHYGVIGKGIYDTTAAARIPEHENATVVSVMQYLHSYADSSRLQSWLASIHAPKPASLDMKDLTIAMHLQRLTQQDDQFFLPIGTSLPPVRIAIASGSMQYFHAECIPGSDTQTTYTFYDEGSWTMRVPAEGALRWIVTDPANQVDTIVVDSLETTSRNTENRVPIGSLVGTAEFPTRRLHLVYTSLNAWRTAGTWSSIDAEGTLVVEKR